MSEPRLNSPVAIAKLLSTEGFTDHIASLVTRYALKQTTAGQRRRFKRNKKLFSAMVKENLSETDKMVLGKFMGAKLAMSFDVGLRIGLTAFLNLPEDQRRLFLLAVLHEVGDEEPAGL